MGGVIAYINLLQAIVVAQVAEHNTLVSIVNAQKVLIDDSTRAINDLLNMETPHGTEKAD